MIGLLDSPELGRQHNWTAAFADLDVTLGSASPSSVSARYASWPLQAYIRGFPLSNYCPLHILLVMLLFAPLFIRLLLLPMFLLCCVLCLRQFTEFCLRFVVAPLNAPLLTWMGVVASCALMNLGSVRAVVYSLIFLFLFFFAFWISCHLYII